MNRYSVNLTFEILPFDWSNYFSWIPRGLIWIDGVFQGKKIETQPLSSPVYNFSSLASIFDREKPRCSWLIFLSILFLQELSKRQVYRAILILNEWTDTRGRAWLAAVKENGEQLFDSSWRRPRGSRSWSWRHRPKVIKTLLFFHSYGLYVPKDCFYFWKNRFLN